MKKWMAALFVLVLTAFPAFSMAEGIDLSALSNDELVALLAQVQEEIVERHIERTAKLAGGAYIVGKDIPAGTYIYTCQASGEDWGNVTVYSENGQGDQVFWKIVSAPKEGEEPASFFMTLNEGDQLKSGVPFSLTIYAGVMFK